MIEINNLKVISGGIIGVVGEAVAIGGTIFTIPGAITGQSTFEFGETVGAGMSQWFYDTTHPDAVGQMVYPVDQFGYSYIAPVQW